MNSLYNVSFVADKLYSRLNRKCAFGYLWCFQSKVRFFLRHLFKLQHYEIVRDYIFAIYESICVCLFSKTLSDLRHYFSGITGRYSLRKSELVDVIIMTYYI